MTPRTELRGTWIAGGLLAVMPAASFLAQYLLSARTDRPMFQHLTVTYVDWVFVPFNLLVVHAIDWRRGATMYGVAAVSVIANAAAHAIWQSGSVSTAHMFSAEGQFLQAGWVHLVYSTLQMTLLLAFIFARRTEPRFIRTTTLLAVIYLFGAGVSGYEMNNGFTMTDLIMVVFGLIGVLVYPYLARSERTK